MRTSYPCKCGKWHRIGNECPKRLAKLEKELKELGDMMLK